MKSSLALLLLLSYFTSAFCASSAPLSLAVVINRHGARAPLDLSYDSLKQWTGSAQELTSAGHRMSYVLGATYAKYYPTLLLPYSQNAVHIESTNVERTINTAKSFMQGVYNGQVTGTAYSANISAPLYTQSTVKQVISTLSKSSAKFNVSAPSPPIHTSGSTILAASRSCAKSSIWQSQNDADSAVKNIYTTYMQDLVKYLKTKKISAGSMGSLYNFADLAIANAFNGLPIPGDIDPTSQYYQDLKLAYEWSATYWYTAQELQTQLTGMSLLQNVFNLMDKVVAGKSPIKYSMFSAHDVTLLPVLASLGIVNNTCILANYVAEKANKAVPYPNCVFPSFTANLAFDLYGGKSPYVEVYYNGDLVKICNNKSSCGLSDFRADVEKKTNYAYNNANFKLLCAA